MATDEEILAAMRTAKSPEELAALDDLLQNQTRFEISAAVDQLSGSADRLLTKVDQLQAVLATIPVQPNGSRSPLLEGLAQNASAAFRHYYEGIAPHFAGNVPQDTRTPLNDEAQAPAAAAKPPAAPPPAPAGTISPTPARPPVSAPASLPDAGTIPAGPPILDPPTPSKSRNYADLAAEYLRYFAGARLRPNVRNVGNVGAVVERSADRAIANRARYEAAGSPLGIPWWFICGIHMMESGFNFGTHLHNGDPLTTRTVHVPAGRPTNAPASGHLPYTWEESAADALKMQGFAALSDWSLPRCLYRWENYNGFGYRPREVPTPYLWSFTTIYERGRYVADNVFDPNSVSQQCGIAAMLVELIDRRAVVV